VQEAAGQLPAAPEQPGDLSRERARQELAELEALAAMDEGFGRARVVTTGDVIHRTAKGMGTERPYVSPHRESIKAKRDLSGALDLEDRKQAGRKELAEMTIQGYGGMTKDQRNKLTTERASFRRSPIARKLREGISAADEVVELANQSGSIAHQMAARKLLAASGEDRYSEQDIKGVLRRAGIAQSTWDMFIRTTTGNMTEGLRKSYKKVAKAMSDMANKKLRELANESAEGYSKMSGVPVQRVLEAYGIKGTTGGEADEKIRVYNKKEGTAGLISKKEWERHQREGRNVFRLLGDDTGAGPGMGPGVY